MGFQDAVDPKQCRPDSAVKRAYNLIKFCGKNCRAGCAQGIFVQISHIDVGQRQSAVFNQTVKSDGVNFDLGFGLRGLGGVGKGQPVD